MQTIVLPDWLRGWIPPGLSQQFEVLIASTGPLLQGVLEALPFLAGTVTVLAWVVWGVGAFALFALAVGAHLLIAMFQRRSGSGTPPAGARTAA